MNLPIRQHYIPVWLQNHFVAGHETNGKIWVHDLQDSRSFLQMPRNVGYEKDLYTLEQPHGNEAELYVVETQANAQFDGDGSRIVAAIRASGCVPSGDELHRLIAVVSWQAVRTPTNTDAIVSITEKFYGQFLKEVRSRPKDYEIIKAKMLTEVDNEDLKNFSFECFVKATAPELMDLIIPKNHFVRQALKHAVALNELFLHRTWKLLVAKDDDRFVIGDSPVQPIPMKNGNGFYADADSFIVMPITQHLALAGVVNNPFGFKDVQDLPREKVALINRVMVGNARRWVFSTEETFHCENSEGKAEKSNSFFEWRAAAEVEAKAAGRTLHVKSLPDDYYNKMIKGIFDTKK